MRKIFDSMDFTMVGHYHSILESNGIQAFINNLVLNSTEGPCYDATPELWVVNDADYDAALRLLREHRQSISSKADDWICPRCGAQVPKEFDVCWKCETGMPQN